MSGWQWTRSYSFFFSDYSTSYYFFRVWVHWARKLRGYKSHIDCVVRVPALSSRGIRLKPRSWQLVKAIGGIRGPCKIVYDWWYKRQKKVCELKWAHLMHIIRGVSKSRATQRICNRECAELSGIAPKPGYRGMENLATEVTDSAKRHPWGTSPLP